MPQSLPAIMPSKVNPHTHLEQPKSFLKMMEELHGLLSNAKCKVAPAVVSMLIRLQTERDISYADIVYACENIEQD